MHRMIRTFALAFAVVAALLSLTSFSGVSAQGGTATPAAPAFASLGYPELHVTLTDANYEVDQQEVPAGLVLVVLDNMTDQEGSVDIFGPPVGTPMDEFVATAEASPEPGAEEEFPEFLYRARITGGVIAMPGEQASVVVDLPPGDWAVAGEGDQEPAFVTATEGGADQAEPDADVTVEMQEFAFAGLPEQLSPGPKTWKIENTGDQPHMMIVSHAPNGVTADEIVSYFSELGPEGTPAPDAPFQEEDFATVGGLEISSGGQTAWIDLDLEPGSYFIACYVPDPETGMPHFLMGMAAVVTVGADGAAAAPSVGESSEVQVEIKDFTYQTDPLEIPVGTTVTWTNRDMAPHTATSIQNGGFDTGRLNQGESGSVTFDTVGTYQYGCTFHPKMSGTIVVS